MGVQPEYVNQHFRVRWDDSSGVWRLPSHLQPDSRVTRWALLTFADDVCKMLKERAAHFYVAELEYAFEELCKSAGS